MTGREIIFKGKKYNSIQEAADALGINAPIARARLSNGFTLEEAFSKKRLEKRKPQEGKKVKIRGKIFSSIANAHSELKIKVPLQTVNTRIHRGLSVVEAMELVRFKKKSAKEIKFRGKIYSSLSTLARAFGVSPKKFISKIKQGKSKYTIAEALGLKKPRFRIQRQTYKIAGGIFKDFKSMCKYYKIRESTVVHRLDKLGWSLEQALEIKKRKGYHPNKFGIVYLITNKINQKKYVGTTLNSLKIRWKGHLDSVAKNERMADGSLGRAIKKFGPHTFTKRIIARCSFLDDMTLTERKFISKYKTLKPNGYNLTAGGIGYGYLGKKIKIQGRNFDSLMEVSKVFKISYSKLTYRIGQGYTPEEAVGLKYKKPYFPNQCKYNINGKKFYSSRELANYFKIDYNFLRGRIYKYKGRSVLKIIEDAKKGPIDNAKPLKVNGIRYTSIEDAMRKNKSIALSLSFGIGLNAFPEFVAHIPDFGIKLRLLLTTGLIPAGLLAFALNASLPKK